MLDTNNLVAVVVVVVVVVAAAVALASRSKRPSRNRVGVLYDWFALLTGDLTLLNIIKVASLLGF